MTNRNSDYSGDAKGNNDSGSKNSQGNLSEVENVGMGFLKVPLYQGPSANSLSDNRIMSPMKNLDDQEDKKSRTSSIDKSKPKKLQRSTSLVGDINE